MQGRKCFGVFVIILTGIITISCSGSKVKKADCYDCAQEEQSWKKFSWNDLEGTWKGSLETLTNEISAKKKDRKEEAVEINFVNGQKFLAEKNVQSCGNFPEVSVVLQGKFWYSDEKREAATKDFIYEVFGKMDGDRVSYGRATINKVNGANICSYQKIGRSVGMNRLALPSMNFSQRMTPNGRVLASGTTPEFEVNMEFINFDPSRALKQGFAGNSRKPASIDEQDKPPLFFRVFKITNKVNNAYARGEWTGTKEYLYRLWRVR